MQKIKSVSTGTYIRTALILLALVNQGLTLAGKNPLPFGDKEVETFVSYCVTVVTALLAWWKNNSFTANARTAQDILKAQRAADKQAKKLAKANANQKASAEAFVNYPEASDSNEPVG